MSIRVFYISPVGEQGGAESALLNVLKYHDRSTFEPIVCFLRDGPLRDEVKALGVREFVIPSGRLRNVSKGFRAVCALRQLIASEGAHIVFSNMPLAQIYGGMACLGTRAKRVWFLHGITDGSLVDKLAVAIPSDRIYVNSRGALGGLKTLRANAKAVQLLYDGVDVGRFSPDANAGMVVRKELGIATGTPVVGMVARFQYGKGQHIFLQAVFNIRERIPNAKFIIVGDTQFGLEPEYKLSLQRVVRDLRLEDAVRFVGFRKDVPRLLAAMDVVVLPCLYPEAFGLALAEAMAMEKPVVASNLSGPTEVIKDGETGFLVSPGDIEAIVGKVCLLLNEKALSKRLGTAGRQWVKERFSMERMIRELEQSYMELLRGEQS